MTQQTGILKKRTFLYLTEFFSGMSVMAVELGASRLIAPYFSSSQIVWTIIIGTIMIAMAAGNVYGGRKADMDPSPERIYRRILIAAVYIAAIPAVGKYVIIGISGILIFTVDTNFLIIAAFVCCLLLFAFPLFLLGTVTPSLAKACVNNLSDSGRVVGNLGAFQTIGSIIGTFIPTFVSIPAVGTAATFLIFAGILLAICLVFYLSVKGGKRRLIIGIALFVVCCIFGRESAFAFWQTDLVYEGESIYNYLQVYEDDRQVALSTNVLFGVQSVYQKDEGLTGLYYDYVLAAPSMAAYSEKVSPRMLVLGMGSGTAATLCGRFYPQLEIEGVEIDQKITDLSYRYFHLPEDMPVATYDGRAYLQVSGRKYDVILVDAYQDITIPFQMSTTEFFTLVREHLSDDGVMVVNMNMRGGSGDDIASYLADTICAVFGGAYVIDPPYTTNRVLYAANGDGCLDNLVRDASRITDSTLSAHLGMIKDNIRPWNAGGHILTDDRAPVELLGVKALDGIIAEETGYYKTIFQEEGLGGLLRALSP